MFLKTNSQILLNFVCFQHKTSIILMAAINYSKWQPTTINKIIAANISTRIKLITILISSSSALFTVSARFAMVFSAAVALRPVVAPV